MDRPNRDPENAPETAALQREIHALRTQIERLNAQRIVRIHNSMPRTLAFQFARGLAAGLGTVVGATFLVSVLAYALSGIDFLPIIGEWAAEIARQIQLETP